MGLPSYQSDIDERTSVAEHEGSVPNVPSAPTKRPTGVVRLAGASYNVVALTPAGRRARCRLVLQSVSAWLGRR